MKSSPLNQQASPAPSVSSRSPEGREGLSFWNRMDLAASKKDLDEQIRQAKAKEEMQKLGTKTE
jgi:hypothetical protein